MSHPAARLYVTSMFLSAVQTKAHESMSSFGSPSVLSITLREPLEKAGVSAAKIGHDTIIGDDLIVAIRRSLLYKSWLGSHNCLCKMSWRFLQYLSKDFTRGVTGRIFTGSPTSLGPIIWTLRPYKSLSN